jgi:ParB/RepB/Spo0J family partition protein
MAGATGGMSNMKDVPVKAIRENKEMLRGCNKQSPDYQELKAGIQSKGLLSAISVRDLGDGTYGLVDGLQRWNIAQDLGWEFIPAQIVSMAEGEILEAQIVANAQRIETRPVEYTKALLKLLAMNPTLTMSELARRLGKSITWLSERFHLLKLNPQIQELVNENKIPLANGYALSKVPEEFQSQFLESAMTQSTTEFVPQIQKFVKEHREAIKQGRSADPQAFIAVPHLQKLTDIKQELETGHIAIVLINNVQPKDLKEAFLLGVKWSVHMDPLSVDASKANYEKRKKEADEAKKKRAEERAAKKEAAEKEEARNALNAVGV